jgi:Flp pilus assembly protein TadG
MSDPAPAPDPVSEQKVIEEDSGSQPETQEQQDKQQAFDSFAQAKKEDGVNMNVKVYSPSRVYYDDLAFSVSATNDTGEFDILPKHHPFISLLNACDLIVRTVNEGNRQISISGGMMHVKADQVIVFLDI